MKVFRFGIIGCGLMGREFASAAARWLHLVDPAARPEIVAVSDINPAAMEWFGQWLPGVKLHPNYRDLLADKDIDAVYAAVPHDLHQEVYLDILKAGRHLLGEKPFGIDLPAATAICQEIEKRPGQLVRCSSEFPFFPAVQRICAMHQAGEFGQVIEVRASFCHSSDLDPSKPINWKRRVAQCGEYGCLGDLGLHVLHLPLRLGFRAKNVRALLSRVYKERPDGKGGMTPCETWDNATLACEDATGIPLILETKRISPGDTNSWNFAIYGTKASAEFTTRRPKTLRTLRVAPGTAQAWQEEDLGYNGAHKAITGGIFEFGFPDAIQQMWASYLEELAGGTPKFPCATPEEALLSHKLFTAALESQRTSQTVEVPA